MAIKKDCRVFIVEDDFELAEGLVKIFGRYTSIPPLPAHNMEAARSIMTQNMGGFDLVIMDVMLPENNEDTDEIQRKKGLIEDIKKEIGKKIAKLKDEADLSMERYKRNLLLEQIQELIVEKGGIRLIKEWREGGYTFPVLYLTSVRNSDIEKEGLKTAAPRADWIDKPAPSEKILMKCDALLEKKGKNMKGRKNGF